MRYSGAVQRKLVNHHKGLAAAIIVFGVSAVYPVARQYNVRNWCERCRLGDRHARFYRTSTGLQITAPLVDLPYPLNIIVALDRIWPASGRPDVSGRYGGGWRPLPPTFRAIRGATRTTWLVLTSRASGNATGWIRGRACHLPTVSPSHNGCFWYLVFIQ